MGKTFTSSQTLETTTCPCCGVLFAAPEWMLTEARRTGGTIYCPSGHPSSWTRAVEDRKKEREIAQLKQRLDQSQAHTRELNKRCNKVRKQLSATKGVVTRIKNRVQKGMCPCCNKYFDNLEHHMSAKHPGYRDSED